ncbi:hypothetical protein MKZ38_008453 [Zalerion maritima]|uniref:Secreted protein n=1 Tax=Zalerion maritima TaxID=339359 RepID=A0AAD5RHJ9_9PEZI|nr:hypothetical protein MKZ38_008453 [Zalerion maritima]
MFPSPRVLALGLAVLSSITSGAAQIVVQPEAFDIGVSSYAFDLSQVTLSDSRWKDNQDRTLNYLKNVDVERMLYVFRANHNVSTNGAETNGGWDAPDFPFRSHFQGHFLTAWSYCYAQLGDSDCKSRAQYFVEELKKCQDNNEVAGYSDGYLSGFPESEFSLLENRTLGNGNVPYYAVHKTLAGLLDVWRHMGDNTARDALLALASWVDWRTGRLTYAEMQSLMETEFGGMNEVISDIYHQTGDEAWLEVASRFDHKAVFDPLAENSDELNGLHANTQVPKWIGAAKEYKGSGNTTYKDIAANAWLMTVNHHSYSIGGNSQSEHFRPSDAIADYLLEDTCEACNTYNMLKLTRELWVMDPEDTTYFDFYERSLLNHLLGQQNPDSDHGHITYFTPLNAGGSRGVGPAWGGGTWSTDYDSFWCCQGTALETNTKLMDSIYFHDGDTLYVNLFTPSVLDWVQKGVRLTQSTDFPQSDVASFVIEGSGNFEVAIRVPGWVDGEAEVEVNGEGESVDGTPGSYLKMSRSWSSGDEVTVRLPMNLHVVEANNDSDLASVHYGPVTLCGMYGDETLDSTPSLSLDTIARSGGEFLVFTAETGDGSVTLGPFYEAQGYNYNVYWAVEGDLASIPSSDERRRR